ncbi:hypothetical protein KL86APRO_10311 [uncultured Alphaproteobacteria bacterium]|uniref:Uncharacterized protein n=1 Tax=uncultured Alphaproteobacteria bacterium TaxID=91750 RepID=A0A212J082_9PROT|nr:hypothetical protein KL86APRO_10311 [uncultured Alphaproteobacteria bacterium]
MRSDADKENPDKQIAEGPNLVLDSMARVTLADNHAGRECSECRRKTGGGRDNRRPERNGEREELGKFRIATRRYPTGKHLQRATGNEQSCNQCHCTGDDRYHAMSLGGSTHRIVQKQECDSCQVLKQKHCNGQTPLGRSQSVRACEHLEAHGRG